MKRLGRQLMALGVLAVIALVVVSASGPGPELRQQIGIVGAIGIIAFVGGFLLWLIGIVFGSEGRRAAAPVTLEASGSKKCPRCAESVKAEAKVCRFCGYDFTAASEVPAR